MEVRLYILIAALTGALLLAAIALWFVSPTHPIPIISLVVLAVVATVCAISTTKGGPDDQGDDEDGPRSILRFHK